MKWKDVIYNDDTEELPKALKDVNIKFILENEGFICISNLSLTQEVRHDEESCMLRK